MATLVVGGAYRASMWAPCAHNEETAVRHRVIKDTEPEVKELMTGAAERQLQVTANDLFRASRRVAAISIDSVPLAYSGAKRTRAVNAVRKYKLCGVTKQDVKLKCFCKREPHDMGAKANPIPRAIQYPKDVYWVALARYLRPVEHVLYRKPIKRPGQADLECPLVKGMNMSERGVLIARLMKRYGWCANIDASRFDAHVTKGQKCAERRVYNLVLKLAPDERRELNRLLKEQHSWRGKTFTGTRYRTDGQRASGVFNTGLGNSIITLLILAQTLKGLDVQFVIDGDDALVFAHPEEGQAALDLIKRGFASVGHKIKIERVATRIEEITFCQTQPVEVDGHFRMVRDYVRVFSRQLASVKLVQQGRQRERLLATIGLGEAIAHANVPIMRAWARCVLRAAHGAPAFGVDWLMKSHYQLWVLLRRNWHDVMVDETGDCVADRTRISFAAAFGVSPAEQVRLEEWLNSLDLRTTGDCGVHQEFDKQLRRAVIVTSSLYHPGRYNAEK